MAKDKYLIDTSILVDALRKHKKAQRFLDTLTPTIISVVTQAELI